MTYKQMQKLMGLVQYAPEEEQNELKIWIESQEVPPKFSFLAAYISHKYQKTVILSKDT